MVTDEIPLSTTAERQAVASEIGAAPEKEWVIVTRGLKRDYDMISDPSNCPKTVLRRTLVRW